MKTAAIALACLAVIAGTAQASLIDDFESYADAAAMNAPGAWGDDGGFAAANLGPAPTAVLAPSDSGATYDGTANPPSLGPPSNGQFMWTDNLAVGGTAKHVISPLVSDDAQPIIWGGDFYDDGRGNKRVTLGLRDNGGGAPLNSILEMGRYNVLAGGLSGYGIRTVFIGGPSWTPFPGGFHVPQAGWHHFEATIRGSDILFELDLGDDGTVDSSLLVATPDGAGIAYNVLRLGGPSDLSSAGGGAGFDNLSIEQIPEPTAGLLLGLGALLLRRRR